jgi:hypothetical protein
MNVVDIGALFQGPTGKPHRQEDSHKSAAAFRDWDEFNLFDRTAQRMGTKDARAKPESKAG